MTTAVTACRPLSACRLWVRFADGVEGVADLAFLPRREQYASWRDPGVFAQATINPTSRSIVWPGGVDVNPALLRELVLEATAPAPREPSPRQMSKGAATTIARLILMGVLLLMFVLVNAGHPWLILVIIIPAGVAAEAWRRRRHRMPGTCPNCGYGLGGLPPGEFGDVRCPECGYFSDPPA